MKIRQKRVSARKRVVQDAQLSARYDEDDCMYDFCWVHSSARDFRYLWGKKRSLLHQMLAFWFVYLLEYQWVTEIGLILVLYFRNLTPDKVLLTLRGSKTSNNFLTQVTKDKSLYIRVEINPRVPAKTASVGSGAAKVSIHRKDVSTRNESPAKSVSTDDTNLRDEKLPKTNNGRGKKLGMSRLSVFRPPQCLLTDLIQSLSSSTRDQINFAQMVVCSDQSLSWSVFLCRCCRKPVLTLLVGRTTRSLVLLKVEKRASGNHCWFDDAEICPGAWSPPLPAEQTSAPQEPPNFAKQQWTPTNHQLYFETLLTCAR